MIFYNTNSSRLKHTACPVTKPDPKVTGRKLAPPIQQQTPIKPPSANQTIKPDPKWMLVNMGE